jgi:hypothetical protein
VILDPCTDGVTTWNAVTEKKLLLVLNTDTNTISIKVVIDNDADDRNMISIGTGS